MNLKQIIRPYTMLSDEQMNLVIDLASKAKDLPGDFVECGVCNGGAGAILAHFAAQVGKRTWLFDSFEGLPIPTEQDTPSKSGEAAIDCVGEKCACVGSIEAVKKVLSLTGANMEKVEIVKGWFDQTFPLVDIPQIALLNLDSDWYESETLCWNKFWDCVVPGGFVYLDDFNWWPGCHQAALDFFTARGNMPVFHDVMNGAWIQKAQS